MSIGLRSERIQKEKENRNFWRQLLGGVGKDLLGEAAGSIAKDILAGRQAGRDKEQALAVGKQAIAKQAAKDKATMGREEYKQGQMTERHLMPDPGEQLKYEKEAMRPFEELGKEASEKFTMAGMPGVAVRAQSPAFLSKRTLSETMPGPGGVPVPAAPFMQKAQEEGRAEQPTDLETYRHEVAQELGDLPEEKKTTLAPFRGRTHEQRMIEMQERGRIQKEGREQQADIRERLLMLQQGFRRKMKIADAKTKVRIAGKLKSIEAEMNKLVALGVINNPQANRKLLSLVDDIEKDFGQIEGGERKKDPRFEQIVDRYKKEHGYDDQKARQAARAYLKGK